MNTNHINPDSEARRESARQADGKFGTQEYAEAPGGIDALARPKTMIEDSVEGMNRYVESLMARDEYLNELDEEDYNADEYREKFDLDEYYAPDDYETARERKDDQLLEDYGVQFEVKEGEYGDLLDVYNFTYAGGGPNIFLEVECARGSTDILSARWDGYWGDHFQMELHPGDAAWDIAERKMEYGVTEQFDERQRAEAFEEFLDKRSEDLWLVDEEFVNNFEDDPENEGLRVVARRDYNGYDIIRGEGDEVLATTGARDEMDDDADDWKNELEQAVQEARRLRDEIADEDDEE